MAGWDGVAAAYDRSFALLCAGAVGPVLDRLGPVVPGSRLLDVGTGTGRLARAAADAGYRVAAVDRAPSMARFAAERVPEAETAVADALALPFADGTFARAVAAFVVNHVDDPLRAVGELRRVLAEDGRAVVTIWPAEPGPMHRLWNEVVAESGAEPVAIPRLPPERDFERSPDGLRRLLEDAGFRTVETGLLRWTFVIEPDDLWLAVAAGIATIGQVHAAQTPARRRAMRAAFDRRTGVLATGGLLRLDSVAVLGVGTR